ncbi:MAG: hypothetical protein CL608_25415 [Anaerolineaceae bacterium]|nr:hypothetical protein [Anaerolineaceae bacterium]
MLDSETLQVTLLVTDVLDRLEIPYVIGGSVASIFHGMVRTTMDVDIVAELEAKHVESFVPAVQEQFYIDKQTLLQAIERRSSVNLIHLKTMFKVDKRPFPFWIGETAVYLPIQSGNELAVCCSCKR